MCVCVRLNPSFLKFSATRVANTAALCIIYPHSSTTILTAAEETAEKVHTLQLKDLFHKLSSSLSKPLG